MSLFSVIPEIPEVPPFSFAPVDTGLVFFAALIGSKTGISYSRFFALYVGAKHEYIGTF